ncbi:MAG: ATP-binding protein [Actinomycetes bacterium]
MVPGGQEQVSAPVSAREAEVLAALADHRSNTQIAHALHISVRTVESHVSSLLRKYGVTDRRELADLVRTAPGLVSGEVGISGLPASRTSFVGREAERAAVRGALTESRLVTLLGPGGMGKTRLAAVVASDLASGACGAFVDLVPVREGLVARAVAAALGVTEQPPQTLEEALADRLRTGRTLLVLDNCEQVLDEVAVLAELLLSGCSGLTVLATSRERLGVPGERTVLLRALPADSDAVRLFGDRALAVDAEFVADDAVVGELCARLDGMPLAIELAAARAGSLGIDGLRSALDDQLRLLGGGRGTDPRHRSLRAVIGWSHDLLDDAERTLFRRLSVFVGGFDLDAACAISPHQSRGEVADLAGRLADKSLTVRHGTRWRMLETIRLYAAEQLGPELDSLKPRYLRWAATTASRLESSLDAGTGWQEDLDEVVSDLRAALAGTPAEPDVVAHRLARSLAHLTFARRDFVEARAHYRAAAERAEDPVAAARDLRSAADTALAIADGEGAVEHLLTAADLAVAEGNVRAAMLACAVVTIIRHPAGALYDVPAERTAELIREAECCGDPDDPQVNALLAAARAWDHGGRRTDVRQDLATAAVEAARRTGDPVLTAAALDALCTATQNAQRLRETRTHAQERLRLLAPLPQHEPYVAAEIIDGYHVASTAAISVGDLPEALALLERATEDPTGDHPYISLPRRIRAYALTGRFDEAAEQADLLWERWLRAGSPPLEWMSSAFAMAAAAHGLAGDGAYDLWHSRACEIAGVTDAADSPSLAASAAFAEAVVAIHGAKATHGGQAQDAARMVERAFAPFAEQWWAPYARAAGADLAVVAGLPDAGTRLDQAAAAGAENLWAAACLTRAAGRLRDDPAALTEAAEAFARIGAAFEHDRTLRLLG